MAAALPSVASPSTLDNNDNIFYSVVERLKSQNALPTHCFIKQLPFFDIPLAPKETQIRELFENACDEELCKYLLKNVAPLPEGGQYTILPQNYSCVSVMSFAQIVLFKVLACPDANCPNCPREIATHNQYKDFEYECPFYHHEKDRRRLVIFDSVDEEFVYKANYFEEGRRKGEKDKYSQNYFESMFHPLYYKMFRCKRDFCNKSAFCPFFHCEEEKKTWDNDFSNFIKKDRVSYVKDKQRPSPNEKRQRGQDCRTRLSDEELSPQEQNYVLDKRAHVKPYKNRKPYQQYNQQAYYEDSKINFGKHAVLAYRKDSDSSFEENHNNNGFFSKLQASLGYEIY